MDKSKFNNGKYVAQLRADTEAKYKFMENNKDVDIVYNPDRAEKSYGGSLEYWEPGDGGAKKFPRPKNIGIDKDGIEIYSDRVNPTDLAGDVLSHSDRVADRFTSRLAKTINAGQNEELRRQYYRNEQGPLTGRPLENATDAVYRTAVLGQGGAGAIGSDQTPVGNMKAINPKLIKTGLSSVGLNVEQQNIIDLSKQYVHSAVDPGDSAFSMRSALGL